MHKQIHLLDATNLTSLLLDTLVGSWPQDITGIWKKYYKNIIPYSKENKFY